MPITAESQATAAPWACLTAQTQQECDQQALQAREHDAGIMVWLVIAVALLAVGAYRARHRARRATVRALRLLDRCAYAIGIDSRAITARWRERS